MTTGGWTVAGRQFRTRRDYEAACRDNAKIDKLKSHFKLTESEGLRALQKELQSGRIKFETMVGDDFIYEVEQLVAKTPQTNPVKEKNKKDKKRKTDSKNIEELDEDIRKEILRQLSIREKRRKRVVHICTLVAVLSFAYITVYYYFTERTVGTYEEWSKLKQTGAMKITSDTATVITEEGEREILDEYKTLYNKNKSLIGWVKIDDTIIDYPVMQTVNNEYYLTHNLAQNYDKNGSIFMDKDCDIKGPSTNLIIYGHHMKSGQMFGGLDKYSNKDYYEKHPTVQFDTIFEKGIYDIMYVFRSKVYTEDEIVFKYYQFIDANSAEEFNSYMEEMSELSLYDTGVTARYGDELLTLSTCDSSEPEGRFVVVAKRVK